MNTEPGQSSDWHLDKKVPISLLVAIVLQAVACIVYVSRMEARFDQRMALLEADNRTLHDRDSEMLRTRQDETKLLVDRLDRLEQKLDRLIERRH